MRKGSSVPGRPRTEKGRRAARRLGPRNPSTAARSEDERAPSVPGQGSERVFVGLGSNLGDRLLNLSEAIRRVGLLSGVTVVARGPVLDTAPLLPPGNPQPQPRYLNTVIELATTQPPDALLQALLAIEQAMGRTRAERWASRVIDLDLLMFGDRVVEHPGLVLPHPGLANRRFVLEPLIALGPGLVHPVSRTPLWALLRRLPSC
jgi:2-amino-4-hydroxy-6-hydroxymethyldihydropteridine diphosphokinase